MKWLTCILAAFVVQAIGLLPALAIVCPNCFAVFVMPDTQWYTHANYQPAGGAHFDLLTRYICANRTAWQEPATGKEMPILMVVQLGDLVQSGVFDAEWQIASSAFDNLDACDPVVPYVVTIGNHDLDAEIYKSTTNGYNVYFGPDRWAPYQCADPSDCDWAAGEWFVGAGDPIAAFSRNNAEASPGPPTPQPGRHRAAAIRTPNGQRMLFIGVELAFDFPPPGHPAEGDDAAWIHGVLADHAGTPTTMIHHQWLEPNGIFSEQNYGSDSFESTEELWNELIDPYPQVLVTFNGHFTAPDEGEWTIPTTSGSDVFAIIRNYQGGVSVGYSNGGHPEQGEGWNTIAVFDPDAGEIRIRSYRIEDVDNDGTHDGVPAATANLDADFRGWPQVVFAYDFPDTRPASLDNCPSAVNPDQADADGDGVGDACDLTCADGLDNDNDGYADYPADPGCRSPDWHTENPACNDGIDNDGDGLVDLSDLQCGNAWQTREARPSRCGLGWELALVLAPLIRLRRATRVIRDQAAP